jgi:hypothetical protein
VKVATIVFGVRPLVGDTESHGAPETLAVNWVGKSALTCML